MGKKKMSETLGLSEDECEHVLEEFDSFVPFIGDLSRSVSSSASRKGFIKTIYGRRRHFDWWSNPDDRDAKPVYGFEQAIKSFGTPELRRAFTHKAYNALIQGSSADQTKVAIRDACRLGFIPKMTVHDEISWSVPDEARAHQLRDIMEHAIELKIETKADLDLEKSWC
jgi:DNA polymerase-1